MSSTSALSTDLVPPSERLGRWSDALAKLCGRLEADTFGAKTINGLIELGAIGPLKVCNIEASRHRVGLSAELAKTAKHPVVKVIFQLEGESIYEQDGLTTAVGPGDCLAYDVSRPHRVTSAGLTKHWVVIIPHAIAAQRGMLLRDLGSQHFSARTGVGRLAYDLIGATLRELPRIEVESEPELAETILDLLTLPLKGSKSFESPATTLRRRVEAYVRHHYQDPELNIEQIAAAMGCSKRYLHLVYADQGVTLNEHIWTARLDASKKRLEQGERTSITEVAFGCGFSSASHFSRSFKRRFGFPPSSL